MTILGKQRCEVVLRKWFVMNDGFVLEDLKSGEVVGK